LVERGRADQIEKINAEIFVAFVESIFANQERDGLARVARRERERAQIDSIASVWVLDNVDR